MNCIFSMLHRFQMVRQFVWQSLQAIHHLPINTIRKLSIRWIYNHGIDELESLLDLRLNQTSLFDVFMEIVVILFGWSVAFFMCLCSSANLPTPFIGCVNDKWMIATHHLHWLDKFRMYIFAFNGIYFMIKLRV